MSFSSANCATWKPSSTLWRWPKSGHLVLSTLHLERATDAVRRIIEVFPEPRDLIRRTVARNLAAVIAQRLLPRADRPGRVPVNEVLLGTPQMRRMIAENAADLTLGIEAGRDAGMQTMDDSIFRCYRQGILSYETAWTYIADHERLGPACGSDTKIRVEHDTTPPRAPKVRHLRAAERRSQS